LKVDIFRNVWRDSFYIGICACVQITRVRVRALESSN